MAPMSLQELPSSLVADAALVYLRRRRHPIVRWAWVELALRRWDAWETNALLPDDLQRPVATPVLPREALDSLERMLTEELARLDGRAATSP